VAKAEPANLRWWQMRRNPRFSRVRALRAFVNLPGSLSLAVAFAALGAMVAAGAIVLDIHYRDPGSGDGLGPFEAFYLALTLVVVSPVAPLPDDGPSRAVFVLIPLTGLLLLGQLVVRLTVTILNRNRWETAVASTYSDHVIVCGLGRVGFRVVRWLLDLGEDVVVIDLPEDEDQLHDQVRAWGVPVVCADARRVDVLEDAGVARCSSVMPITDDDLVNLSVATAARSVRPDVRVVLRTFEDRLAANLQQGFDIYRAYSTSALAAPAFAAAATHAPVDYAFAYGEGDEPRTLMTITKFTVVEESPLVGWTLGRVQEELVVQVLAHRRTSFNQNPPDDVVLEVGDGFVVSAGPDALDRIACLTPPTRELGRYREGRWVLRPDGNGV
jgi:voltage-gated potassium channel